MRQWIRIGALVLAFAAQSAAALYRQSPYEHLKDNVLHQQLIENLWVQHPESVVVLYFFSYGCPWCYKISERLDSWQKGMPEDADVKVVRIPVVFHPAWGNYAKAYFTLQGLDKPQDLHNALFQAIQVEHQPLSTSEEMGAFFVAQGVPEASFTQVFNSFSVGQAVQYSAALMRGLHVMEVPMIFVHTGQDTIVTSITQAGSVDGVIDVLQEQALARHKKG